MSTYKKLKSYLANGTETDGHTEYPKFYDWDRFRIFEHSEDLVFITITDEYGNLQTGFDPMNYRESINFFNKTIPLKKLDIKIESLIKTK